MDGQDPTELIHGLIGDLSLYTILLAVLFGLVGFAAFRYGRKNHEPRPLFIGIALMAYGYFVSNAWVSLAIGSLLTLGLFFPR
jgi:MFS family permease